MATTPRPTLFQGSSPTTEQDNGQSVKLAAVENILSFMAVEYENSMVFTLKRGDHLEALRRVDSLYRHPRTFLHVPEELSPIASMMLFCHFQFYMTFTNYMRCHLTYALVGVRKAIDAALSAYVLIEQPGRMEDYLKKHNNFVYVKKFIAKLQKSDSSAYPIAKSLIKTHETCSQYAAHVDIDTLNLMTEKIDTKDGLIEQFKYFNVLPEVETELLLVDSMFTFVEILRIFAPFVKQYSGPGINFDSWAASLDKTQSYVLNALTRAHQQLDAKNGAGREAS